MMQINLLPWREMTDKRQKFKLQRQLVYMVVFPLLLFILQHVLLNLVIQHQVSQVVKLNKQLAEIKGQSLDVKKNERNEYLQLSASVDSKTMALKKLLNNFGNMGLYHIRLVQMIYFHQTINFIGRATSIAEIERWRKALHENYQMEILEIKRLPGLNEVQFHAQIE